MATLDKVLYTAKTHTTGGRDGASRTSDGRLWLSDTGDNQNGRLTVALLELSPEGKLTLRISEWLPP